MTSPIRVLIADGSPATRSALRRQLTSEGDVEVVGSAANGRQMLQQIEASTPHVVVLDIEMPEMDGLRALALLRTNHATLPVIMFSRLLRRGAPESVEARLLGANESLQKPEDKEAFAECVARELIPRIRSLVGSGSPTSSELPTRLHKASNDKASRDPIVVTRQTATATATASSDLPNRAKVPIEVIAIASSTGGPAALADLLSGLPSSVSVPIVVVQHMGAGFTGGLADRLATKSGLKVLEAQDEAPVDAAQVWIARGDYHLFLERRSNVVRLRINQAPPENECRPAADVLFRSVADIFGPRVMAIVLTGMGNDGLEGSRHIRATGGRVLVQDQASSAVWGMPGQVANAGLADAVLPINQLSREIMHQLMQRR